LSGKAWAGRLEQLSSTGLSNWVAQAWAGKLEREGLSKKAWAVIP
jgi:hypothetical protein